MARRKRWSDATCYWMAIKVIYKLPDGLLFAVILKSWLGGQIFMRAKRYADPYPSEAA